MESPRPEGSSARLKRIRLTLWAIVGVTLLVVLALAFIPNGSKRSADQPAAAHFGGPFTLVGGNGQPFSSARLKGKPYALYFGFTRCGDVCPTTLQRLAKLRDEAGGADKFNILFITIDPEHDGPKEVGQYATLFNTPIIGLTGSGAQIDAVKKQFGIFAEPTPHAGMGKEMEHTATVLLFDRDGNFMGTVTPNEGDTDALATLKALVA
jgi:protein SCO1/2